MFIEVGNRTPEVILINQVRHFCLLSHIACRRVFSFRRLRRAAADQGEQIPCQPACRYVVDGLFRHLLNGYPVLVDRSAASVCPPTWIFLVLRAFCWRVRRRTDGGRLFD